MRQTRLSWGRRSPSRWSNAGAETPVADAFDYFEDVDRRFSLTKGDGELSGFNAGACRATDLSAEMCQVMALADLNDRSPPSGHNAAFAAVDSTGTVSHRNFYNNLLDKQPVVV